MQELEKILEEIDGMIERYKENPRLEIVDICYGLNQAKRIIRKHLSRENTTEITRCSRDTQGAEHEINLPKEEFEMLRFSDSVTFRCGNEYVSLYMGEDEATREYKIVDDGWIPVEERLPENDDFVLATVTGIYNALTFSSAIQLASYCKDDGWFIEGYPDWENPNVSAWRPLPEPYRSANKTEATDWREDMLRKFDRRSRQ